MQPEKIDMWEGDEPQRERPDWLYEWFADFKIGARVVDDFAAFATRRTFGEAGESDAIVLPVVWREVERGRLYRARRQHDLREFQADGPAVVFNARVLDANPEEVIWVNGDLDVLALAECGLPNAVASRVSPASKSGPLATHETELAAVNRMILAGDSDASGLAQREELARRLGRHRCWLVTWPEGCAGASDVLCKFGPDAVLEAIRGARQYPIEGVHRIERGMLLALRQLPAPPVMSTGTYESDKIVKLPADGRLIVVTGFPASGKTSWVRYVTVHTASKHNRRWAVFSPESQPWGQFVAQCAEAYTGKVFYPVFGEPSMTAADIDEAEAFLAERVTMLVCDAENQTPTVDWILERGAACVLRDGTTDLLVDPWNEIDQRRGDLSETDFIGRSLQRFKAFGLRYGCNVWIVCHPAKPPPIKLNEKRPAPGPYDISGSSHWANKSDVGLTIHSPDPPIAELHVWKCRFQRWGTKGTRADMVHAKWTGQYTSAVKETETHAPISSWTDTDR